MTLLFQLQLQLWLNYDFKPLDVLGFIVFWRFGGKWSLTQWNNDGGVCRKAPATPGLLWIYYVGSLDQIDVIIYFSWDYTFWRKGAINKQYEEIWFFWCITKNSSKFYEYIMKVEEEEKKGSGFSSDRLQWFTFFWN